MKTQQIKDALQNLDCLYEYAAKLRNANEKLNFTGHQEQLSATIAGITVQVTSCDRDSAYESKVRRGYEMIHLGVKKVYQSRLDDVLDEISALEQSIKDMVKDDG